MSVSTTEPIDQHSGPWTEADFFALPVNRNIELLDGSLLVSPSPTGGHQWLCAEICIALNAAAPSGRRAIGSVNVRLGPDRILIPDVAVIRNPAFDTLYFAPADVELVVEVTSPSNAYLDRGVKPQLYALAGIPHYVRVEVHKGAPTTFVHVLDGETYTETARFASGELVRLDRPFPVELDLAALMEL